MIRWKLNEVLAAKRVTGRSLAEHLGVHENSVSRLRRAKKMPRLEHDTLDKICIFLDCQVGDLLERSD